MLDTRLSSVLRTTKQKIELLKSMGISTVLDLLEYFPRAHEDATNLTPISLFILEENNVSRGFLSPISDVRTRHGKRIQKAVFRDSEGAEISCIWFHQAHLARMFTTEREVILSGKVKRDVSGLVFMSPTVEPVSDTQVHTARIVPVYRETEGITSKWIREKMQSVISYCKLIPEFLPEDLLQEKRFPLRSYAISQMHFPDSFEALAKARERLAFEEAFLLQTRALSAKARWKSGGLSRPIPMSVDLVKNSISALPFTLTGAQKIALYEILKDMEKPEPMLRLLQGDVGCGKTIVAALAAANAVNAGFQCAVMAPTEILAKQHFAKFFESLKEASTTPPRVELLIGSLPETEKQRIRDLIAGGEVDIIIGTHALIQESVSFRNLGLAVIDEQHRFGVEQRLKLRENGSPHLLMMTATPIPRSLALTIYGDQDLSVIDEMPPGRKEIVTRVIGKKDTQKATLFVADQMKKGRQVFVVCPLIDESEKMELKSVTEEYERLLNVFPEFRITYLHGKMKSEDKDRIMKDFRDKKFDMLVSTSVIEVGIDIPNASVMIIESAERFGLSQLHQFRGRVGRGADQSYCFLFVTDPDEATPKRLRAMERWNDGFKLAEIDLQIRGPGQLFGTRQSGLPDFKLASIMDSRLISQARKSAETLLTKDATLSSFPELRKKLASVQSDFLKA